jgi:hypothetical protein
MQLKILKIISSYHQDAMKTNKEIQKLSAKNQDDFVESEIALFDVAMICAHDVKTKEKIFYDLEVISVENHYQKNMFNEVRVFLAETIEALLRIKVGIQAYNEHRALCYEAGQFPEKINFSTLRRKEDFAELGTDIYHVAKLSVSDGEKIGLTSGGEKSSSSSALEIRSFSLASALSDFSKKPSVLKRKLEPKIVTECDTSSGLEIKKKQKKSALIKEMEKLANCLLEEIQDNPRDTRQYIKRLQAATAIVGEISSGKTLDHRVISTLREQLQVIKQNEPSWMERSLIDKITDILFCLKPLLRYLFFRDKTMDYVGFLEDQSGLCSKQSDNAPLPQALLSRVN